MLISYNWIKKYFNDKLPSPLELADLLMYHSFEIEGVEEVKLSNGKTDTVIDADVLPNRAHDCLSEYGMAREVAVLTGLKLKEIENKEFETSNDVKPFEVEIADTDACRRYISVVVEGVKVGPSPEWLKECLEALGQKSINNIVDATNYIMFGLGQPMHAFDKDKLDGNKISVRWAREGEEITTLDNKSVKLSDKNLIIADEKSPLAIAGVKGGKKAEVDKNTKNLVLESANFKPIIVRKTSRGFAILTDSSKRFENEISPEIAGVAMNELVALIKEIANSGNTKFSIKTDIYPRRPNLYKVGFKTADVNKILGINISEEEVEDILKKISLAYQQSGFNYEKIKPLERVLKLAPTLVGAKYKLGASVVYDAPKEFDCSSFTAYVFAQNGVAIPRVSVDQFVFGKEISENDLRAGDLVFANTGEGKIHHKTVEFLPNTEVSVGVDHTGLYLGDGKIIHATRVKGEVVIEELKNAEQFKNIVGYRRIVQTQNGAEQTQNDAEKMFVITAPYERLDLRIKQDLVEEIGRVYGYKNIEDVSLEQENSLKVNKEFYYINKIRKILTDLGFVEILTYALTNKGVIEAEKAVASNRGFGRINLKDTMIERLEANAKNAPLLGLSEIQLFEIGKVFPSVEGEYVSLAIGVQSTKGKKQKALIEKEVMTEALEKISTELGIKLEVSADNVFEINLSELVEKMSEPTGYNDVFKNDDKKIRYQRYSAYPFMLRDIALWVSVDTQEEDVLKVITENAGELLVRTSLFDVFEKTFDDGSKKKSYAFNLVFQSNEKTLMDDEVNEIMDGIAKKMKDEGWEVR